MDFITSLLMEDYFALFFIIAIGIAIGNVKIVGFQFDLSAVIFVALFFGHFINVMGLDFSMPKIIQNMGLLLFIYTIGMQAGPSFFDAFKAQGVKLIILASLTVVFGALTTYLLGMGSDLDMKIGVGLFTGALTSTPGLAAAIEASKSPLASIGYGIAYPFGVIGVILFIKFSPKLFSVDLKKEEEDFLKASTSDLPELKAQNFIVSNHNIDGKNLGELNFRFMTEANISRVMRKDHEMVSPSPETVLHKGDLIRAVGSGEALKRVEVLVGEPTQEKIPRSGKFEIKWYVVTNKRVVNKTLSELNLMNNYQATVTRIRRSGIDIVPRPSSRIRFGDKLLISSSKGNVQGVTDLFGDSIKRLSETSFLPVALGVVLGVILGKITIPLGGFEFKLGLTGGILLTSIVLSYQGKTGPVVWHLSGPANQLLRQFGLLLFLTPVGINAGKDLAHTINEYGFGLFGIGAAITLVPMLLTTLIGRYVFRVNFLTLMGTLTGGMTSTPGLSSMDSMTDSEAPAIAYAAVYPFALVFLIVCSQLLGAL